MHGHSNPQGVRGDGGRFASDGTHLAPGLGVSLGIDTGLVPEDH